MKNLLHRLRSKPITEPEAPEDVGSLPAQVAVTRLRTDLRRQIPPFRWPASSDWPADVRKNQYRK